MHFYILSIFFSVALVSAQKRHIYLGTRSLVVPQNWRGTVEYLSADGSVEAIAVAHWAVLFSECGPKSPYWKPDSTKTLGTIFELYKDDEGNNQARINDDFRPREADGWTFKPIGTTSDTDDQLRTAGIIPLFFLLTLLSQKLPAPKAQVLYKQQQLSNICSTHCQDRMSTL
jgi:hypothetical protein